MDSKVAQKWKGGNNYSNINHVYTMFKGKLMLITEVWKWDVPNVFPSLNVIKGRGSPYDRRIIIRHYHYHSDPRLGHGIFEIRKIPCSYHDCANILSLSWDSKIKKSVNHPRYGWVYNCKYFHIIACCNTWIIMNFLDDGTNDEAYEFVKKL